GGCAPWRRLRRRLRRCECRAAVAAAEAGRPLQRHRLHRRVGARAGRRQAIWRSYRDRWRREDPCDARPAQKDRGFLTRVLIVRLGALGDVVHAIPVAAALRRAFPSARIDWLVSARHREILDLVPAIDRRLVINDRPSRGSPQAGDAPGGTSLVAAIRELRQARYDVAFDL